MIVNDGNNAAYGVVTKGNGDGFIMEERHASLTAGGGQAGQGYPCALTIQKQGAPIYSMAAKQLSQNLLENAAPTILANDYKEPNVLFLPVQPELIVLNDQGGDSLNVEKSGVSPTLRAEAHNNEPIVLHLTQNPITSDAVTPCVSAGSESGQATIGVNIDYTVRRLTPLECERLQGYPDQWTDIGAWADVNGRERPESPDSARYKAIGNSIALPPWEYVLQKLSICCGGDVAMASLFDGIGGFPLIWERLNGAGACLWASEIEDFPIAVTKKHFNEEQEDG